MRKIQSAALAAALLAAFVCSGCSQNNTAAEAEPTAAPTEEPTPTPAPATNPLTGEEGDYTNIRPVAVAIRTEEGALPQWGVASADVLIEGITEGYTANTVAVYANVDEISKVGPVDVGKDLFLQLTIPLNALPVHINKNIYAENLLNLMTYQDLDGYHIGKNAFAFDEERNQSGYREENCWYTTAELIQNGLSAYDASTEGANTPLFSFGVHTMADTSNAADLQIGFSGRDTEQLVYNADTDTYLKYRGDGTAQTDADNGEQVSFTNVFVLYVSSGIKDDGYTRDYDFAKGGTGLYLTNGGWEQINWTKGDAAAPLMLTDAEGETLVVNKGKSYIVVWGGYYGQSIALYAADGTQQELPAKPELMESGISDEQAAAAYEEYQAQQNLVTLQEKLAAAKLDLEFAYDEQSEAAQTEDTADDEAANQKVAELEQKVADLTAQIGAIAPKETTEQNEENAEQTVTEGTDSEAQ